MFSTRWPSASRTLLISTLVLDCLCMPIAPLAFGETTPPLKPHLPPIATINPTIQPKVADEPEFVDPLEPVNLAAIAHPSAVSLHNPITRLDNSIAVKENNNELAALNALQQSVAEEDLKTLWEATVDRNPVIRFSIEKLALPQDLQSKHSSRFLNKTLSALVSGAVLGSTLLPGGGYYRNMGTMAGGDIVRNLVTKNNKPIGEILSPTEQIQLAGLVDELKARMIQNYYDYKNTLQVLADAHRLTLKNNETYSEALRKPDPLTQVAAASAYYKAMLQETRLRQKAKAYRMALERMAGKPAVDALTFSVPVGEGTVAARIAQPTLPKASAPLRPANKTEPSNTPKESVTPPPPVTPVTPAPKQIPQPQSVIPKTTQSAAPQGSTPGNPKSAVPKPISSAAPAPKFQIQVTPKPLSLPPNQPMQPPSPSVAKTTPPQALSNPTSSKTPPMSHSNLTTTPWGSTVSPQGNRSPKSPPTKQSLKELYNDAMLMEY